MKRLLLFLLVLVSVAAWSDIRTRTHTFDFTNPEGLIPSVTHSTSEGGLVDVSDTVFQSPDGCVLISFETGKLGADIKTENAAGGFTPCLTFYAGVTMIVKVKDDQVNRLKEFSCPTADPLGGVILQSVTTYFGEDPYVPETRLERVKELGIYRWQGDVASINFYNGGMQPSIHQFTVMYTLPRESLKVHSTSPANGSTVTNFDGFTLTFDPKVVEGSLKKTSQAEYSLTDSEGNTYELNVTTSGNKVTFTPKHRLTVAGLYTLNVAEGSFSDDADFCNVACTYSFTLAEQLDTFAATSISPEGKLESLANGTLVLTFPDVIGNINNNKQITLTNQKGIVVRTGGLEKVSDNTVKIVFTNNEELSTLGIYTLLIPEGMVYDAENKHYNPEITYTYNIGNAPSDAQKLKVSQLLSMSGIGYPTFGSNARMALLALDETSSAADYDKAINAYLAETDVEMPKANMYYYLVAVPNRSPKLYVAYNNGVASLVSDIKSAVPLKLTGSGNTFQFATPDGKYLQLPGSSASSIGADAADLVLARLGHIDGVSNEETFGMLSVGSGNAYATVSVSTSSFSAPPSSTLSFSDALTSAFTLADVPESELPEPTDDFKYDFVSTTSIFYKEFVTQSTIVKDTYLNNMTLYTTDYGVEICVSDKEVEIVNYNTNKVVATGKFVVIDPSTISDATSAIKLKLNQEITEGSLPSGQYCYKIHEATYGDKNFGLYNTDRAAFLASGKTKADCHVNTYIYYILTVNNAGGNPEPPVVEHPDAAVLAKAKEVLNYQGVGYPVANAQTRLTLQRLVNNEVGTNDEFNAAIKAYLAETNIQLPAAGKYYNIYAVSANNVKAYLQDQATLTADASKAGAFKAGGSGSTITFENKNGKFLTVLSAAGSLTDAFSATDNNLTLARYPVSGNNAEATFGLITISGNKGGATMMSQVNVSSMAITTSGNTAVFTNDATSAFRFADTSEPTADPVQYTLSPASGSEVSGTKLDVTLTFTGITNVTVADRTKIKLVRGEQVVQATSVTAQQDNTQFAIVFNGLATGTYTLQIEKGAFTYPYNGKTAAVQAITATYTMTEKTGPSDKILNRANKLLAMTGIGYPAADSPARLALQSLVNSGEGTDDDINTAIDAYLADTNIEKPANGKYYRMLTRNNERKYLYFAFDSNKLKMQTGAEGAAVFKATANADGTTTLMAVNDKYLSLPTATGDYLSFTYDKAAHDLTLSRLNVSGVSNEETFGLISMSLGGKYAVILFQDNTAIIQDSRAEASFNASFTSALQFEEVSTLEITMPDVDYTVTPAAGTSVETLEKITISFASSKEVKLKDASKIKLKYNKDYLPKSVTKVEGAQNTFEMEFINIPFGLYELNIEKGVFVVDFFGREEPVQEIIIKGIVVITNPEFAKDFDTFYNLRKVNQAEYVTDVSLNNFRLKADTSIELIADAPSVSIENYLGNSKASGHFIKTDDSHIVRLALDSEIKEGKLEKGKYDVVIEKETLCDANYIQYLADNSSVSLSSCHVNPKVKFTVNVDNEKAAQGIEELLAADSEKYPVYNLMGHKVDGPLVPGKVYLCNGKKYVVKK